jgi:hypothetical protein
MAFNIDKTMGDMFDAMSGSISEKSPEIEACLKQALEVQKDALAKISLARIVNEINDDEVTSQLEDEKVALEVALLACSVKSKGIAQDATDASINVFKSAIIEAI